MTSHIGPKPEHASLLLDDGREIGIVIWHSDTDGPDAYLALEADGDHWGTGSTRAAALEDLADHIGVRC